MARKIIFFVCVILILYLIEGTTASLKGFKCHSVNVSVLAPLLLENIMRKPACRGNVLKVSPSCCFFLVIPEDVAMGFTTYYGFAPRIFKGNDHRVGFGFRFGEHADLQILYEFGPQTSTAPLKAKVVPGTRSAPQRRRTVHRPFLELLIRAGILKRTSYQYNTVHDKNDKEPR